MKFSLSPELIVANACSLAHKLVGVKLSFGQRGRSVLNVGNLMLEPESSSLIQSDLPPVVRPVSINA
jgi:hypothetical protein